MKKTNGRPFQKLMAAAAAFSIFFSPGATLAGIDSIQSTLGENSVSAAAGNASGPMSGSVVGCEGAYLNVRDGAWGNIVGSLQNGESVKVVGREGDWYRVEYNGGQAFVHGDYVALKSQPQAQAAGARTGTVSGCQGVGLNVRDGAWGNVIGGLSDGDAVSITGEDGDWYKISYNGREAFVYKSFISGGAPETPAQPAEKPAAPETPAAAGETGSVSGCEGSSLNVRDGAWGNIIGTLQNGASVKITGEDGDWYKIEHEGRTAYVYKEYISKGGAKPEAPATPVVAQPGSKFAEPGVLDVPLTGQPDGYTCGPTSLSMALQYYGVKRSIHPELATMCKTSSSVGTGADNMLSVAKQLGFGGSYMKSGSIDWLAEVTSSGKPVIANVVGGAWTGGHYVVVTGVKDGKVYINDPAWGLNNEKGHSGNKLVMDVNTFSSIWSGRWNRGIVVQP